MNGSHVSERTSNDGEISGGQKSPTNSLGTAISESSGEEVEIFITEDVSSSNVKRAPKTASRIPKPRRNGIRRSSASQTSSDSDGSDAERKVRRKSQIPIRKRKPRTRKHKDGHNSSSDEKSSTSSADDRSSSDSDDNAGKQRNIPAMPTSRKAKIHGAAVVEKDSSSDDDNSSSAARKTSEDKAGLKTPEKPASENNAADKGVATREIETVVIVEPAEKYEYEYSSSFESTDESDNDKELKSTQPENKPKLKGSQYNKYYTGFGTHYRHPTHT
ncbi:hypothetical protein AC249_AIPGENE23668 [Exaiptasia diaphana]|nr:hypothetical protein AC249_AIPGENE23668 [Exaiptasia diaphana]